MSAERFACSPPQTTAHATLPHFHAEGIGGPVVLFVDDDQAILDSLRRGLVYAHGDWTLLFAEGGAQALEIMTCLKVDAIVSDLAMPGMDGTALLAQVRERHPQVARIVLSGLADLHRRTDLADLADHRCAKPCNLAGLQDGIVRALQRRTSA